MGSPNLAIGHVAASQNQKEVTINNAIDALDKAGNDAVDIDCSVGDTVVTAADYRQHFLLRLTGSPAAAFTLTVPDGKRVTAIHNTTSRSATLRTTTLGATLALPAGQLIITGSRGSELLALAASAIGGLYDMGLFVPGQPAATALVFQFAFPRAVTFPANLTGSTARAATAASSAASFTLAPTSPPCRLLPGPRPAVSLWRVASRSIPAISWNCWRRRRKTPPWPTFPSVWSEPEADTRT